jgi:hypothetical protein
MNDLYFRALRSSTFGFIVMATLLFVPAGTLDYWQAFVFMGVFVGGSAAITVYLAIRDPKLLERRMNVGPTAEKETTQKIIMVLALLGFIALPGCSSIRPSLYVVAPPAVRLCDRRPLGCAWIFVDVLRHSRE